MDPSATGVEVVDGTARLEGPIVDPSATGVEVIDGTAQLEGPTVDPSATGVEVVDGTARSRELSTHDRVNVGCVACSIM